MSRYILYPSSKLRVNLACVEGDEKSRDHHHHHHATATATADDNNLVPQLLDYTYHP